MDTQTRRLPALDGLRGLAAAVVLVHHCLLVNPALALGYDKPNESASGAAAVLLYSPVHLAWAGTEAVYVFFVLSGFVLVLPAFGGKGIVWRGYYPQRLLRLYLPIAAATAFAVLLVLTVHRQSGPGTSVWLSGRSNNLGASKLLRTLTVIRGSTDINTAYWSLKWEVLFSLLLPLFVFGANLRGRAALLAGAACLLLVFGAGYSEQPPFFFLPMFALGALLGRNRHTLIQAGRRFDDWTTIRRTVVLVLVGLALVAYWLLLGVSSDRLLLAFGRTTEAGGAVALVGVFAATSIGRRAGEAPASRWLGTRSFSLYLVHEPIVVAVAFVFGATTQPLLVLALAVPLSLLAADLFFRVVERPSHRLSQAVGKRVVSVGPRFVEVGHFGKTNRL